MSDLPVAPGPGKPTASRLKAWLLRRRELLLVFTAVLIVLGMAEAAVRIGDWDLVVLYKMRYVAEGDFNYEDGAEVYRPSGDSERIYETIPGARTTCINCAHPAEEKYQSFPITINSLGFRGPEVEVSPDDDLFHVLVLGGSNTFGPSVADEDTYPARMQAALDRLAPGRFVVLNAGLNAYVMSQKVRYLEVAAERHRVDLVIIQDYNQGRRAFFYEDPGYGEHFDRNTDLYLENLPWLFETGGGFHRVLVKSSSFWRLLWGVSLRGLYLDPIDDCDLDPGQGSCFRVSEVLDGLFSKEAELTSSRRFDEVVEGIGCPVVVLLPMQSICEEGSHQIGKDGRWGVHDNVQYARLCLPADLPQEELDVWTHIHPPSHVYAWYGERIVEELVLPMAGDVKGLLP